MTQDATIPTPAKPYNPFNEWRMLTEGSDPVPYFIQGDIFQVARVTEAVNNLGHLQNMIDPTGRQCELEIGKGRQRQSLLMDRRLARKVALAILEIVGPDEELPTDLLYPSIPFILYDAEGVTPTGFTNKNPAFADAA